MPRFRRPRSPVHLARRVAAALLPALALFVALRTPSGPLPSDEPAAVQVVVFARDLPAGRVLTAADLAVARYPPRVTPPRGVARPDRLVRRVLAGGGGARGPGTGTRLVGPRPASPLP